MSEGIEGEPTPEPTSPINENETTIESRFLENAGSTRRVDLTAQQETALSAMESLDRRIQAVNSAKEPEKQAEALTEFFDYGTKPDPVLGKSAVDWENPISTYSMGETTKVFEPKTGEFANKGVYLVQRLRQGEEKTPPKEDTTMSVVIINPKLTNGKDLSMPSFAYALEGLLSRNAKIDPQTLAPKKSQLKG